MNVSVLGKALGVDSKLDFGTDSSHSAITSENGVHRVPAKVTKTVTFSNPTTKKENSALICGLGGCNKTDSSDNLQDKIQTDVLVHIETKLDLSHNQPAKETVAEIPDIPVVVGYQGARLDVTADELGGGTYGAKPAFTATRAEIDSPVNSLRRNFNNFPSAGTGGTFSTNFPMKSAFVPSTGSSFYGYRPVDSRNNLYNPDINVNIKTLPPVAVSVSRDDEMYPIHIKYRNNGTRITVPYFEPSFHSHYYGENPPTQHLWYPKTSSTINTVEFKATKPVWSPSQWNRQGTHRHSVTKDGETSRCFCQNGSERSGLGWYPSFRRNIASKSVKHIDDKLEPLN